MQKMQRKGGVKGRIGYGDATYPKKNVGTIKYKLSQQSCEIKVIKRSIANQANQNKTKRNKKKNSW